jgi:hypothetical protein
MSRVAAPPDGTVALTAYRDLPGGRGRQYTAVTFPRDPWQGCEHIVRMSGAVGFVRDCDSGVPAYALLDAIDAGGDILASWDVTSARAFRFLYRKLGLRVESQDAAA